MIDFILASQNLPFTIALTIMLIISFLEGVTSVLGAGISHLLDSILPEVSFDLDVDFDGPDIDTPGGVYKFLGWLRLGQVPALVLFVIFLTSFGTGGLVIQSVFHQYMGFLLPGLLASAAALFVSIPCVRLFGGVLARIMPKDETEAVSEESFIGRIAVITLGKAKKGMPAQAKLKDEHGQTHYIMVEPDRENVVFEQGAPVLLVSQSGAVFKAIVNESNALVDH